MQTIFQGMKTQTGSKGRDALALSGWLALTFSAAATSGFVSTGGWYAELAKPTWNPPSWLFGPVWTALYIMMAVAAWLVWQRAGWRARGGPLMMYLVQWALNALWTPLFFGLQRPGLAFVEILVLVVAIYATLVAFWKVRRVAGLLLVPYALWTTFAAVLNFMIWRMNS
jgi:tryptophan-rich sensory protein